MARFIPVTCECGAKHGTTRPYASPGDVMDCRACTTRKYDEAVTAARAAAHDAATSRFPGHSHGALQTSVLEVLIRLVSEHLHDGEVSFWKLVEQEVKS